MFDYKNPDYSSVFEQRAANLLAIRKDPSCLPILKKIYADDPAKFINDWGCTFDPRNPERGIPALVPFLLYPKQIEWVNWFVERWKSREPGACLKSRETGVSWLSIATAVTICLFREGIVAGFGSRKEEYVDKIGDPKSLFHKARQFLDYIPVEFRGGYNPRKNSHYMKLLIPDTGSIIAGEAGDNIGRGARTSFYFIDEAAFLQRPELVEFSISQTTNCRIDISTPNGSANPFARKVMSGKISVFTMHWSDDPRKDQIWYEKKCREIDDPVVIAQELDLDFSASVEGVVIPADWVRSAIDAHKKLDIEISGVRKVGFDVADEGKDKNAACGRYGILVENIQMWSGKNSDIYETVEKLFTFCDENQYFDVDYDADGLGAGIRGDARSINEKRKKKLRFTAFHGSGEVVDPDKPIHIRNYNEGKDDRTNKDFFSNAKAQAWWSLRRRFQLTNRAVTGEIQDYNADDLISISSSCNNYMQLVMELSQPTFKTTNAGKLLIDKKPDGARSPNLADAVMIAFAPQKLSVDWQSLKSILDEIN